MRRILIFRDINNADNNIDMSEDVFVDNVKNEFNFNCPNMGNKVWFWGLISELDTSYIQLNFYKKNYTIDYINNNFDGIILPDANLFGLPFEEYIDSNISAFEKLRIPIYIISVGLQTDCYDDMKSIVRKIGQKTRRMMDLVYNSGGAVCVRGNITAEFLNKCGVQDFFVGGCPSLYQFGPELRIEKKEYKEYFKVAVNGHVDNLYSKYYRKIFDNYKKSEYFCQDEFFSYLYGSESIDNKKTNFCNDFRLIKKIGICGAELLNQNKINLFCNPYEWIKYIEDNGFSMAFGSRIHGNIVALLAGVPALLHVRDLRTLDIADYYDIPRVYDKELKSKDLLSIYESLDYTKFNNSYIEKYDKFQDFLISCDLVEKINKNNKYICSNSLEEKKEDRINYKYERKLDYELANEVMYIYRKYIKKMKI